MSITGTLRCGVRKVKVDPPFHVGGSLMAAVAWSGPDKISSSVVFTVNITLHPPHQHFSQHHLPLTLWVWIKNQNVHKKEMSGGGRMKT